MYADAQHIGLRKNTSKSDQLTYELNIRFV